jgi:hypothetical protein
LGVFVALAFGLSMQGASAAGGSISGTVFDDLNNDRSFSSETGHAAVTVFLDLDNDGIFNNADVSTTTDGSGVYTFSNVADGLYSVRVIAPGGFGATTTNPLAVAVSGGANVASANVGISNVGAVSGYIYDDVNGNGVQDGGEAGLSGRTVWLDRAINGVIGATEPFITTDVTGYYSFTGLAAGSTAPVRTVMPANTTRITVLPTTFIVTPGMIETHIDFGLFTNGSFGGFVYDDTDGSGSRSVSEAGLSGRTVYCDANGNNLKDSGEPSALTDSSGSYVVGNLGPRVCEPRIVGTATTMQTTSTPAPVTVTSASAATGVDFGSFTYGSVSGTVFNDFNVDGIKQANEPGLGGKTAYLDANNNGALDGGEVTVLSVSNGTYTFTGLSSVTQNVRIDSIASSTRTSPAVQSMSFTSAQAHTLVNFGYFLDATISGQVYEDFNGNGGLTAGEVGLAAQTVFIDLNANDILDGGEPTAVTNSFGIYSFTGITPGTYRVRVDVPAGWVRSSANPLSYTATSGGTGTYHFGLFDTVNISGTVFDDTNGDATGQAGESGVGGFTVFMDANNNGVLDGPELSTLTLTDGSFAFNNLGTGSYRVRVITPNGRLRTTTLPDVIAATSGLTSTTTLFGMFTTITVSGSVFNDVNGDGVRQGGEAALPSRSVFLDNNSNGSVTSGEPTATTDSAGAFVFSGLGPGVHRVRSAVPAGWMLTTTNHDVTAVSGSDVAGRNVGFYIYSSASGQLYNDVNGNGFRDIGDNAVSGRTVYLDANANGTFDGGEVSAITSSTGAYSMTGVSMGTFQARVVLPASVMITSALPSSFTTSSGSVTSGLDFALFTLGSISGAVYDDRNGNGLKNGGEPTIPGRVVYMDLDDSGALDFGEPSQSTSSAGAYSFTGLSAGVYRIRMVPVSGTTQTNADPAAVVIGSASNAISVDFTVFTPMSISGRVFEDMTADGSIDVGDDGVAGLTVFMDANGNSTFDVGELSVLTDATGSYTFSNLMVGSYRVRAAFPSTMFQTTSVPSAIAALSGASVSGMNVGLFEFGSFSGAVFRDMNANGIQDAGEERASGARVYVDSNGNDKYSGNELSDVTDVNGEFTVGSLRTGSYNFRLELGDDQALSTAVPATITVRSGTHVSNAMFGQFVRPVISGTVFIDANVNKLRDIGEAGSRAKTVYLDTNKNGLWDSGERAVQSSTAGTYSFPGLSVGSYDVRLFVTDKFTQTTDLPGSVSLVSGQLGVVDFGVRDITAGGGSGGGSGGATPGIGTGGGGGSGGSTGSDPLPEGAPQDAFSANSGYWMASAEGGVFAYGNAKFLGSAVPFRPNKPIVNLAPTPSNNGYYLVATDGGIFAFGDAKFFGSMGGSPLNKPMVGMATTPSGMGYWTVASDGGIFAYGDARFFGSTGSMRLNKPIVGMQSTPSGMGYWLVASDGGIFAYGDAQFYGSTGSIDLNQPIVAMARAKDGLGYWLVAADGGVFAYGNAPFHGSTGGKSLGAPIVNVRANYNGDGYWMFSSNGSVYAFGSAKKYGERPKSASPIVG